MATTNYSTTERSLIETLLWCSIDGDELTKLAQKLHEIEPYVGDDGVVYLY